MRDTKLKTREFSHIQKDQMFILNSGYKGKVLRLGASFFVTTLGNFFYSGKSVTSDYKEKVIQILPREKYPEEYL